MIATSTSPPTVSCPLVTFLLREVISINDSANLTNSCLGIAEIISRIGFSAILFTYLDPSATASSCIVSKVDSIALNAASSFALSLKTAERTAFAVSIIPCLTDVNKYFRIVGSMPSTKLFIISSWANPSISASGPWRPISTSGFSTYFSRLSTIPSVSNETSDGHHPLEPNPATTIPDRYADRPSFDKR